MLLKDHTKKKFMEPPLVTCDSNGDCHSGDVGLIWWVSMGLSGVVDGVGGTVGC